MGWSIKEPQRVSWGWSSSWVKASKNHGGWWTAAERNIDSDLTENWTKLAQFCPNGNVQISRKRQYEVSVASLSSFLNMSCPWHGSVWDGLDSRGWDGFRLVETHLLQNSAWHFRHQVLHLDSSKGGFVPLTQLHLAAPVGNDRPDEGVVVGGHMQLAPSCLPILTPDNHRPIEDE